jgi:hypothetical protein
MTMLPGAGRERQLSASDLFSRDGFRRERWMHAEAL